MLREVKDCGCRTRSRPLGCAIAGFGPGGLVRAFARFPVQPATLELVEAAMTASDRFGISYRDAAIIEAARLLGCTEVLSEDLTPGRDYGGAIVVNPFR